MSEMASDPDCKACENLTLLPCFECYMNRNDAEKKAEEIILCQP